MPPATPLHLLVLTSAGCVNRSSSTSSTAYCWRTVSCASSSPGTRTIWIERCLCADEPRRVAPTGPSRSTKPSVPIWTAPRTGESSSASASAASIRRGYGARRPQSKSAAGARASPPCCGFGRWTPPRPAGPRPDGREAPLQRLSWQPRPCATRRGAAPTPRERQTRKDAAPDRSGRPESPAVEFS